MGKVMSSNYHFMRYFIALLLSLLFLKTKIGQIGHNLSVVAMMTIISQILAEIQFAYLHNDFHCSTSHHTQTWRWLMNARVTGHAPARHLALSRPRAVAQSTWPAQTGARWWVQ